MAWELVAQAYDTLVVRRLWTLFRHGPLALGFWKGLDDADICARMAGNSNARDWVGPDGAVVPACAEAIARDFNVLVVVAHTAVWAYALWTAGHMACGAARAGVTYVASAVRRHKHKRVPKPIVTVAHTASQTSPKALDAGASPR